jgi:hypothetical protein
MYLVRTRSLLLVTFAAALAAAGCGEGTLSSPTAPSALSDSMPLDVDLASAPQASTSEDEFGALGRGNRGNGRDEDKGKPEKDKSDRGRGGEGSSHEDDDDDDEGDDDEDNRGRRPHVSGFVTAVGADSITVRGITVKIAATTIIRHGHRRLTIADIAVGDHAQAKGTMNADRTVLTATEVKVEDTGRDNGDDEDEDADDRELKGAVAALTGTCPTRTFTIGTTTVRTNASTKFDDVICEALANGNIVEVKGTRRADGTTIFAKTVELESGPNEVEGRISGLTSTTGCPILSFMVGTITVTTSLSTTFSGVACTALANGSKVEVEGTLSGTTLAATSVELD